MPASHRGRADRSRLRHVGAPHADDVRLRVDRKTTRRQRVNSREPESATGNAHDRHRLTAQCDRPAENVATAAKAAHPEIVGQHDNSGCPRRGVGFGEVPSCCRGHAKKREEVPRDIRRIDLIGLADVYKRCRPWTVESSAIAQAPRAR